MTILEERFEDVQSRAPVLAKNKRQEDMVDFLNEDFREYQQWNWSIFVKHAKQTLDDVVKVEEEELLEVERSKLVINTLHKLC